jgi:HEAT repeat protein
MTLAAFLIVSGATYSIVHAQMRVRAAVHVAIFMLIGVVFFGTLSSFRKGGTLEATSDSVTDRLLAELNHDEPASQLDAIWHLRDIEDKRIVPALSVLLAQTKSDQIVEAIADALARKGDPQAGPALKAALGKDHDPFLKLTIVSALIKVRDSGGYTALLDLLKKDEPVLLRSQALELLKAEAGEDFGYNPEKSPAENKAALDRATAWVKAKASSR